MSYWRRSWGSLWNRCLIPNPKASSTKSSKVHEGKPLSSDFASEAVGHPDRLPAMTDVKASGPALYLVSTPIGNLEDITLRALRVLKEVSVIACEDTRQTQKLLQHFAISTKTISYHEHNELERSAELIVRLEEGKSVAIVSDAGTPGISDPGYRL